MTQDFGPGPVRDVPLAGRAVLDPSREGHVTQDFGSGPVRDVPLAGSRTT